jgi:hypothetical protein
MLRWVVVGVVIAGAILATVFGGWSGLVVYAFLAAIAAAVAVAAASGGEWLRGASRGRFDQRR